MGATTGEGMAEPIRHPPLKPLPTLRTLAGAAFLAAVSLVASLAAADSAAKSLLPDHAGLVLACTGLVVFAATALPTWAAYAARRRSRLQWQQKELVDARRTAAISRHNAFVSMGVSGFVVICMALVIFVTANDGAVHKTFMRGDIIASSFPDVARALSINITIAASAQLLSMAFGLLLAVGRMLPGSSFVLLRVLCIAYIDIFRSLPAIVVIYLVCFGIPLTELPLISNGDPMVYAIIALSLTYAAYNAELFRAGIEAVHHSQVSAAMSLGLPSFAVFRLIILPQAARHIAAPLLGNFIALQKDTALVNIVGIVDAFTQAKIFSATYYNLSAVTVVCLLFIIITIPQARYVDFLIKRNDSGRRRQ